ncbi:MAG: adenosine kinase [Alphaproteobacteria bacterium]|nr:adenosine kinase [Alphaproteobacteria bacterium]
MADSRWDVVCIGNAIVDVLAHAEDEFLARHGMAKDSMMLIDAERAQTLYDAIGPAIQQSGGSAANTAAGIASLGGTAAYIGKVADDQLGDIFAHDLKAGGIHFETPRLVGSEPTARSFILITPDGHRTMNTYLGACVELTPDDVTAEIVGGGQVLYLEGYLWDRPAAKEAFLKAARLAHDAGRKVALTLSDSFCVERHHQSFLDLVRDHVDILFANEAEIKTLYRTSIFEDAAECVRKLGKTGALTRSEKGSIVFDTENWHTIPPMPTRVVDTTGAGDLYASGFLYGVTHGLGVERAGHIAAICAAEVISHVGPRPQASLAELMAQVSA